MWIAIGCRKTWTVPTASSSRDHGPVFFLFARHDFFCIKVKAIPREDF
jgi:hypothetical protein